MQRRRKPRAKPRDVFSGSSSTPSKSTKKPPPKESKRPPTVPPIKPSIPKKVSRDASANNPDKANDSVKIKNDESANSTEIIQKNILGDSRKTIGLRDKIESSEPEIKENITSKKAQDIIDKSRARAMESLVKKAITPDSTEKPAVSVPIKKRVRKAKNSFQPAERKRRLDRSRHMEYKYEVRRLLVELNVDEEHRSSLLGTIWAKGERQTVSDAKDFLLTKHSEGVIDEHQLETLNKVVDGYTVRR
ncbi:MAG TPA: hypothetical protein D7H74_01205 [Candidatus Poseidoniales archaeon]|nr:MAG TPA: hypothetical protein D7H74_01205 [Candidatus Poseidoniales archaeon]